MQSLKTREQVRRQLNRQGISIAEWARKHGVSQVTTYRVLDGVNKGRWGEAHKVAVLLGIKDGEIVQ